MNFGIRLYATWLGSKGNEEAAVGTRARSIHQGRIGESQKKAEQLEHRSLADPHEGTLALGPNATSINTRRKHTLRIEKSPTSIRVIFPMKYMDHVVDLSFLTDLPHLAEPFSEAFKSWGSNVGRGTRDECANILRRGIARFLIENFAQIHLHEIEVSTLAAFIKWLDERKSAHSGKATKPKYRARSIGTL
jgi:hypothetical protein